MQEVRHDGIRVSTSCPARCRTGFSPGGDAPGTDWKLAPETWREVVIDLLRHPRGACRARSRSGRRGRRGSERRDAILRRNRPAPAPVALGSYRADRAHRLPARSAKSSARATPSTDALSSSSACRPRCRRNRNAQWRLQCRRPRRWRPSRIRASRCSTMRPRATGDVPRARVRVRRAARSADWRPAPAPAAGRGDCNRRSPTRWPRCTRPASSTATCAPPTSSINANGHAKIIDAGLASVHRRRHAPRSSAGRGSVRLPPDSVAVPGYLSPEEALGEKHRHARRSLLARLRALRDADREAALRSADARCDRARRAAVAAAGAERLDGNRSGRARSDRDARPGQEPGHGVIRPRRRWPRILRVAKSVLDADVEERLVFGEEATAPRSRRLAIIIGVLVAVAAMAWWFLAR